jgi:hypothetical protein
MLQHLTCGDLSMDCGGRLVESLLDRVGPPFTLMQVAHQRGLLVIINLHSYFMGIVLTVLCRSVIVYTNKAQALVYPLVHLLNPRCHPANEDWHHLLTPLEFDNTACFTGPW